MNKSANSEKVCKRLSQRMEAGRNSCHVKCRCRIIGKLISIKVLWESFHSNTLIKGEL